MEKQLVFPFIIEDNKLNGRTCLTCEKQKTCVDGGETISHDHTCGDWTEDKDEAQAQDGLDSLGVFDALMDKYGVTVMDKRLIYISCQHF
jgi:hypothetical protein